MTIEQLEAEVLRLDEEDRARLAQRLLLSLDPANDDVERAWIEEAERRRQDLLTGRVTGEPAEEVFRAIRAELA